jgi:hypothetical protein
MEFKKKLIKCLNLNNPDLLYTDKSIRIWKVNNALSRVEKFGEWLQI